MVVAVSRDRKEENYTSGRPRKLDSFGIVMLFSDVISNIRFPMLSAHVGFSLGS